MSALSSLFLTLRTMFQAKLLGRKFIRDVGALTVARCAGAALSLVQGIVVARWLGPEQYGIAALLMIYPGLVYTFLDMGSADALVKYLSEFQARNDGARVLAMCKLGYTVDCTTATVALLVVVVTAPWVADHVVHHAETAGLIVVYATAFVPRALTGTSYATLAILGRFSLISLLETLTTSLRVMMVLALVYGGWEVTGVVWGNMLATTIRGLLYGGIAWMLRRRVWGTSPLREAWHALGGRRREICGFLIYNDLNLLLGTIPKQLDVILLGYFRNPVEVGYYKLAKTLAASVGYVVGPLQSVTYPQLARLSSLEDRRAFRQTVERLALYVGTPLGLLVLASTLLVPMVIPVVLGLAYLPIVTATRFFIIGMAIWMTFFWVRPLYMARGHIRQLLMITACVVCLTLLAYPLIIPFWGYIGLAKWLVAMQLFSHGMAVLWLMKDRKYG